MQCIYQSLQIWYDTKCCQGHIPPETLNDYSQFEVMNETLTRRKATQATSYTSVQNPAKVNLHKVAGPDEISYRGKVDQLAFWRKDNKLSLSLHWLMTSDFRKISFAQHLFLISDSCVEHWLFLTWSRTHSSMSTAFTLCRDPDHPDSSWPFPGMSFLMTWFWFLLFVTCTVVACPYTYMDNVVRVQQPLFVTPMPFLLRQVKSLPWERLIGDETDWLSDGRYHDLTN